MSDDDPYRRNSAAPAALIELAAGAAAKRRELPREAAAYGNLDTRVRNALGVVPVVAVWSTLLLCLGGILIAVGALNSAAMVVFGILVAPSGIAIDVAIWRAAKERAARLAREDERRPYPVDGYPLWLAAERPLFDVYLRRAVDRTVVIDATAALDRDIVIEWLDERVFRVAIPACQFGSDPVQHLGDRAAWLRFAEKILAPLHADIGIDKVEMGGAMRALASRA